MRKFQEQVNNNSITLKGAMHDILTYLEQEQQRRPKMTVQQYLRLRKIELAESEQFGVPDIREGMYAL